MKAPRSAFVGIDEFERFLESNGLWSYAFYEAESEEELRERFLAAPLDEAFSRRLERFVGAARGPLAVRSSGLFEDMMMVPFSGVYDTYLMPNSHPDAAERLGQLEAAIKLIYASLFSSRSRSYFEMAKYNLEEERMAVVLQELVGSRRGRWFYPHVSGTAQSFNYYPLSYAKPEDGLCVAALGLGSYVVEGLPAYRFCPRYPKLEAMPPERLRADSQRLFRALDMETAEPDLRRGGDADLADLELSVAEADPSFSLLASTWDAQNDRLVPGTAQRGMRIVDLSSILRFEALPFARAVEIVLDVGSRSMGTPVEIEYALNLDEASGKPALYLLQMKPLIHPEQGSSCKFECRDAGEAFILSEKSMGNGRDGTICDIVWVDPSSFDRSATESAAKEIEELDRELRDLGRRYVLVGPGRWGTPGPLARDPRGLFPDRQRPSHRRDGDAGLRRRFLVRIPFLPQRDQHERRLPHHPGRRRELRGLDLAVLLPPGAAHGPLRARAPAGCAEDRDGRSEGKGGRAKEWHPLAFRIRISPRRSGSIAQVGNGGRGVEYPRRWGRAILASAVVTLSLPLAIPAQDGAKASSALSVGPGDVRIEARDDGGYDLYVRAKPGMASILITESTKDPAMKADNFAYRAMERNDVNGGETRLLNGKPIPVSSKLYSLISSTPSPDPAFGQAFRILIPPVLIYGYPWSRSGTVAVGTGDLREHPGLREALRRLRRRLPRQSLHDRDIREAGPAARRAGDGLHRAPTSGAGRRPSASEGRPPVVQYRRAHRVEPGEESGPGPLSGHDREHGALFRRYPEEHRTHAAPAGLGLLRFRIGVVLYKDYWPDEYITRNYPYTSDISVIEGIVKGAAVYGGGDIPEAEIEALYAAATEFDWSADRRQIIVLTDAPPHPDPRGKILFDDVAAEAKASA